MQSQEEQARAGAWKWLRSAGCAMLVAIAAGPLVAYGQTSADDSATKAGFEIAQASAFIDTVFREGRQEQYPIAAELYLGLLSLWGQDVPAVQRALIERYAQQALLPVPREARQRWLRQQGAGEALAGWWRGQDPLPATPLNERLIEHLTRVSHALRHFADRSSDLGFDERGEVFVRLGEPSQRRRLDYFRPELIQRIHELRISMGNHLLVSPSSFHSSEVWFYHGQQPYHFLFVADGRRYRKGEVVDIIPLHLRTALDGTGRGGAKADVVMEVLRTIYQQLATVHISYGQRLAQVDAALLQMEAAARQESRFSDSELAGGARRADFTALMRARGESLPGLGTPVSAAASFVEVAQREDARVRHEREERAPQSHTGVLDGVEILALATHMARFLNRDGTTRAEVYWAPAANALPLDRGLRAAAGDRLRTHRDQLIRASVVRDMTRAERRLEQVHYHTVPERAVTSAEPLPVQTIVVDSLRNGDTVAIQWDQFLARLDGEQVELGPTARLKVLRADAIEPLHGDGRLEMSDLKPVIAATEEPYPFQSVEPTMPLAIYFEAYGLTFGPDDQVDFRVDYEVTLTREGGLLRRSRQETHAGNLVSTIMGTRTEQFLILNPGRWAGADRAHIAITVSDRTTGASVTRDIAFTVVDT